MKPTHHFIFLLALVASSVAQSDDELHIPVENDNQFPPDDRFEVDGLPLEGSGAGVIEEPVEITSTPADPTPLLEDVQSPSTLSTLVNIESDATDTGHSCPTSCVCNIEGASNNYVVDCSNGELTEFPKALDPKTTELNLQYNKLTEIPKDISQLKNLKILNVNNNDIMGVVAGSISELPELTSLKLGNNRLIEYPTDLKNSFGLSKLEELDLGGNDMRTTLKPESFSNFKSLKKLILPTAAADLVEDVCLSLKESLETVCTESCSTKSFDCPDASHSMDDDLLDFALPGLIAFGTAAEDNVDPTVSKTSNMTSKNNNQDVKTPTESSANIASESETNSVSSRSAIVKSSVEESKPSGADSKTAETESSNKESTKTEEVVGATTSSTKTGGVDKSVIGFIVAGMVVVVAGITIKKNWISIKNRFSSSPRNNTNDRTAISSNGTAPEEVPLQEKSPV